MNAADQINWDRGREKLKTAAAETLTDAERECLTFYGCADARLEKALHPTPPKPEPAPAPQPSGQAKVATRAFVLKAFERLAVVLRDTQFLPLHQRVAALEAALTEAQRAHGVQLQEVRDRLLEVEASQAARHRDEVGR
jgi:hypothetical protein